MKYRLVFKGELSGKVHKEDCLAQLAQLFGKDTKAIESELFRGKPIVVKKTSDDQVASRFISAFEKAGAVLHVDTLGQASSASESSMAQDEPEETEETVAAVDPDTEATRLRPAMRRVEPPPIRKSPKLTDDDRTRQRRAVPDTDDRGNSNR